MDEPHSRTRSARREVTPSKAAPKKKPEKAKKEASKGKKTPEKPAVKPDIVLKSV